MTIYDDAATASSSLRSFIYDNCGGDALLADNARNTAYSGITGGCGVDFSVAKAKLLALVQKAEDVIVLIDTASTLNTAIDTGRLSELKADVVNNFSAVVETVCSVESISTNTACYDAIVDEVNDMIAQ